MELVKNKLRFRSSVHRIAWFYGVPIALTALLYFVRLDEVTPAQLIVAFFLLLLPWRSYVIWREGGREELPIYAMLGAMFWLAYGVPLFLEEHSLFIFFQPQTHHVPEDAVTAALLMALVGMVCLWLGMKSGIGRFVSPRILLSFEFTPSSVTYLRSVVVIGIILSVFRTSFLVLGEGGRQFVVIMLSVVPMLAFAVLFSNFVRGKSSVIDKVLILAFLLVRFVSGLSGGLLADSASVIVICGAVYLTERRKVPRAAVVIVLLFYLFFQVGKNDFRKVYWLENEEGGRVERVTFWTQASLEKWSEAISNPNAENIRNVINPSVSRVSLLTQTANVIDQTPSVVPYQYGRLYSYMVVTWIPRFLWPEKPSVNEANQFYQVAYGLTAEEELAGVSIAVGYLAESFINFGWFGVVAVMFTIGVFFDFYQKTFVAVAGGVLMNGLGLVLLPQLVSLEFQMAQYLSGIAQTVIVTLIVMLPVIRLRRAKGRARLIPVSQAQ